MILAALLQSQESGSGDFTFADALGYVFGAAALASSLSVVLRRDAVVAAINLVLAFFCLSGVYLLLGFPFLAAIQVLVYAGAIMVLFLFVIMLLGVTTLARTPISVRSGLGATVALAVLVELSIVGVELAAEHTPGSLPTHPGMGESVSGVSELLFRGPLVLPFEIAGVILLAAMIGVVVLARRDLRIEGPADFARKHAFDPRPLVVDAPSAALPDGLEGEAPGQQNPTLAESPR